MKDLDLVHLRRPRLKRHIDALPCKVAKLLAVALERRKHRRHLHDIADKLREDRLKRLARNRPARAGNDLSMRVLRVGRIARLQLGHVGLFLLHQIIKQAGRLADHQRQDAGGLRIKRTGMAHLIFPAQLPAHADHNIAGGHPRRLEHHKKSIHIFIPSRRT